MSDDLTPVFDVSQVGDRDLVTCKIGEHVGSARVLSDGLEKAKQRAQAQAEAKLKRASRQ